MRIVDVAHVRFTAPDLDLMSRFISDFGMEPFRDAGALFGRGLGSSAYLHQTELGEPAFRALGLMAPSVEELREFADNYDCEVLASTRPGGGWIVEQTDPDGYLIEIVAGQTLVERQKPSRDVGWNDAIAKSRIRAVKRIGNRPSQVVRLGHCVLGVSDFRRSEQWYKERFGFITSDEIVLPDGKSIGAFLRCDRGDEPTDHHSLFLIQGIRGVGFNHAAFEIVDADDLFAGHEWLSGAGWKPHWGVGRHLLGSQIFDYWRDPWGHALEHWTDGDLLVAADGSRTASLAELTSVQWGHPGPHAA